MSNTRLDPQRYFEFIDDATERLLAVAARGLDEAVPCCPGWTVADVVTHLAQVYEHKVRVMADNAWPTPWPPDELADQPPLELLIDAKAHLFAEFANHLITDETTTFSHDDQTIAFWARRMALEVAVHAFDVELAHDDVTPIADDIALDGIDEVLNVMLAGPWWSGLVSTRHPLNTSVLVRSEGLSWVCDVQADAVTVNAGGSAEVSATVSGEPMAMFLWLWGRLDDDRATVSGEASVAVEFRARLAECLG
jgi:uncharacterized protein (TIGR03083 family)